jgi:hypothetical protein
MVWASRILIGVIWMETGRIWAQKLGECKQIFDNALCARATNPNQHIQNGPKDPQTTINYHYMDILKDAGMG